ncbi:unnamed protein product, partial [Ectocarpus sp. 12 AP-2014]
GSGNHGHRRGAGSEAVTASGSVGDSGHEGGRGLGVTTSGRVLIPSVFCSTPIPIEEPRPKRFHSTGHSDAPQGGRSGSREVESS